VHRSAIVALDASVGARQAVAEAEYLVRQQRRLLPDVDAEIWVALERDGPVPDDSLWDVPQSGAAMHFLEAFAETLQRV
jgi:hypothetical protein